MTADVSVEDKPFIAPPASQPEKDRTRLHWPDAMAEAEAVNPTDQPSKRKRGGFSLFRRKEASQRQEATKETAATQSGLDALDPKKIRETVPPESDLDSLSDGLPSNSALAPKSELLAPEPAQPLSPSEAEEDLLEIPAFLRRQAN